MAYVDPRYRRAGDTVYVELKLRTVRQLFDARDPAPFRARDLDAAALEYLLDAADDLPDDVEMALVFHFTEEPTPPSLEPDALIEAVRGYLGYEQARLRRRLRRLLQQAGAAGLAGLAVLALSLGLVRLLADASPHGAVAMVREGVTILGWVALWRPLEVALYDWWPLWERGRLLRRVAQAPMRVEARAVSPAG